MFIIFELNNGEGHKEATKCLYQLTGIMFNENKCYNIISLEMNKARPI